MKVCKISAWAVFAVLLAVGCPLWAQITIEWDEIPHVVGTRWTKNFAYDVSVNLGTAGGPQTWTFTSQPMGPDSSPYVVFPVNEAPFHDSFPDANLVYASVLGSDSVFLYMRLEPDFLSTVGVSGTISSGICAACVPVDTNDLPDHYDDSRYYHTSVTVRLDANSYVVFQKRGFEHFNAHGTIFIPYGSFPCLRLVQYDTLIQTTYLFNIPVLFDTVATIVHQFAVENLGTVAVAISEDGETNPYFNAAATLERLTYFETGIDEGTNVIVEDNRLRVQPNPFSYHTNIYFSIEHSAKSALGGVGLDIYDATGRLVKHFDHAMPHAPCPMQVVSWDGTDLLGKRVPDGVYFYRLRTPDTEVTGKLIKTR